MNIYQRLIKSGEKLFRQILNEPDPVGNESFNKWYTIFRSISVESAWRKVWVSYHKKHLFAVAAILMILLSAVLFLPQTSDNIMPDVLEAKLILPASDNIVLRTSSGRSVIIDSVESVDTLLHGVSLDKDEIKYSDESSEILSRFSGNDIKDGNKKLSEDRNNKGEVEYNELYVPKGRVFSVVLSDGTKVWLNSESYIKYPVNFSEKERVVTVSGEAFFDVVKDDNKKFKVKTSGYSVNVLGTKFNLRAYENDEAVSTTLVEGSVSVNTDESSEFTISPGEQFSLEKSTQTISVSKVDVHLYTSWIENQLILRSNTLSDIFKVLQRRYDVDVFFSDEQAKLEEYSGEVPLNDNLNVILDQISKVSEIEFQIEGRLVVVRYK